MKRTFLTIFSFGLLTFFASCDQQDSKTEEKVIERDTVGVEYEIEEKVQEKEVDTTERDETIEYQKEDDQMRREDQNQGDGAYDSDESGTQGQQDETRGTERNQETESDRGTGTDRGTQQDDDNTGTGAGQPRN